MKLLHLAADMPQCNFAEARENKLFPNQFSQDIILREGVREITTESFLLAKQGRYSEAIADQSRGFRIAEHAASDPTLLNYLVAYAIEQITLRGMEGILDLAGPNADVARQVQQVVALNHSRLSLKYALSGDVAVTLIYIDRINATTPVGLVADAGGNYDLLSERERTKRFSTDERKFLGNIIDAVKAEYLHQMRNMTAVANAPPGVRDPVFAAAATQLVSPLNPIDLFANRYLSVYPYVNQKANHNQAHEQALMAGAAALETRGRTGAFPEQLPGNFTDAFHNDQPLKYHREGTEGFVIYSVGPTGKFDGGQPGQSDWQPETEIAFRYPAPAPKPVPPDMLK